MLHALPCGVFLDRNTVFCACTWISGRIRRAALAYGPAHPNLPSVCLERLGSAMAQANGLLSTYVTRMLLVLCTGSLASVLLGFFLYYRRSLKAEIPDDLHGSAQWATERDVERMGLISYKRREGPFWKRQHIHHKASGPCIGALDTSAGRKIMRS